MADSTQAFPNSENNTAASVREVYSLVQNSMERIEGKIDAKFDKLDLKIDLLTEKFNDQTRLLEAKIYDHFSELNTVIETKEAVMDTRLIDLETWQTRIKAYLGVLSAVVVFGVPIYLSIVKK